MGELRPTRKAAGQSQRCDGRRYSRIKIRLFNQAQIGGEFQNHSTGVDYPGFEIKQAGEAFADTLGDGVGSLGSKPPAEKKDVAPVPSTDGGKSVGQDRTGFSTRGATQTQDADRLRSEMRALAQVGAMTMTMGVVAERTMGYLLPRMFGGGWVLF